jgi:hypothetical protein
METRLTLRPARTHQEAPQTRRRLRTVELIVERRRDDEIVAVRITFEETELREREAPPRSLASSPEVMGRARLRTRRLANHPSPDICRHISPSISRWLHPPMDAPSMPRMSFNQ